MYTQYIADSNRTVTVYMSATCSVHPIPIDCWQQQNCDCVHVSSEWSSSTWRGTAWLKEQVQHQPVDVLCCCPSSHWPSSHRPSSHWPPRSQCLVPGVFKLSCSTPFTHFLRLVSVYRPFHLYFIPKTLTTMPLFSAPFLQLISI